MKYEEPTVQIISAEQASGVSRLVLQTLSGQEKLSPPLAPASLHKVGAAAFPADLVYELHKCVGRSENLLIYDTYEATGLLPVKHSVFVFRLWWMPDQWEAATDTKAEWVYQAYPAKGDHDHCLLTWETIAAYGNFARDGYHSEHGWITVEAYHKYIEQDAMRLRRDEDYCR